MKTRIAKDFYWEMSHRLPFHDGLCRNIHGHTYRLRLELLGELNNDGMVLDYYEMAKIIKPILNELDHSFMCDKNDSLMLDFLKTNGFKYYILEKTSTAEHIAEHLMERVIEGFKQFRNIELIKVRIYETEDVFAEIEQQIN
jgi:6-pyruvoyltetrahydropterin/6-carboxytetrahydropterin synthase